MGKLGHMELTLIFMFGMMSVAQVAFGQNPLGAGAQRTPSMIEGCGSLVEFRRQQQGHGSSLGESLKEGYARLASAGQLVAPCLGLIEKRLENARRNHAQGNWADCEKEVDRVVHEYRDVVQVIEGVGGIYEQGTRAVYMLEEAVKDMVKRYGENDAMVIQTKRTRDCIISNLESVLKTSREIREKADMLVRGAVFAVCRSNR